MTQLIFFWTNGDFIIAFNALCVGTVIADKTVVMKQLKGNQM